MKHPSTDRRTRRTHNALNSALVALMEKQPYDSITIQAILDRADVGRSTFYTHFYDKDDLLHSSIASMFTQLYQRADSSLMPSLALFQHIADHQALYHNLARSQRFAEVLKTLEATLSTLINQRLGTVDPPHQLITAMIAPFLAGSFIKMVDWWLIQSPAEDVQRVDATFRHLALTGVEHCINGTSKH